MRFRIGIHLGDVMMEGDDVYGDGVNIAARLQELADPGGILISGPVYDQVHNKLSIGFDRLGQQHLKNVVNPVTGYRVLQFGAPTRPRASRPNVRMGPLRLSIRRMARSPASLAPGNGTLGCLVSAPS
jgi:adenylate cyclase